MVTINFTLFVETGLFLLFLWLMHRYVFKPLLQVMDERSAKLREDKEVAARENATAEEREKDYAAQLGTIHFQATRTVLEGKREANQQQQQKVAELKAEGARELESLRRELQEQVAAQQDQTGALASELKDRLAETLGLRGTGS